MKNIAILGSTGSIGINTLDVVARHPDRYAVFALSAHSRSQELAQQCQRFQPRYAVMNDADAAEDLHRQLREMALATEVLQGEAGLETIAAHPEVHVVMAAIVGAAGLAPALAAAQAGKTILLANKEALVISGALFMKAVRDGGAILLPIDSEHNAVFQALPQPYANGLAGAGVSHIILTASGGPFRSLPLAQLHDVTPEQACAHPNWVMGRKISVDSATMMNKGLEVIEAHWLFDAKPAQIDVLIHPQSVIHSMVQYRDGSVIAQLGNPDMRTPIAYALGYPERIDAGVARLDLADIARLDFEKLDLKRFPCVGLAYEALAKGGTASAILNAANEVAVQSFLQGKLRFTAIETVLQGVLENIPTQSADTLEHVLAADRQARHEASERVTESNI